MVWSWSAVNTSSVLFRSTLASAALIASSKAMVSSITQLGVGAVQRVIDAAAFHHQEIAVAVLAQHLDCLDGHFGQARLVEIFLHPVQLVIHVIPWNSANSLFTDLASTAFSSVPVLA